MLTILGQPVGWSRAQVSGRAKRKSALRLAPAVVVDGGVHITEEVRFGA